MKNVILILLILFSKIDVHCQNHDAVYYYNLGVQQYKANDYKSAIVSFSNSIDMSDSNSAERHSSLVMRAFCKVYLTDYRGAILDCNKALNITVKTAKIYWANDIPEMVKKFNSMAYLIRGMCKLSNSDIDGACLDWSSAGELGNSNAYDYINKYCSN